MNFDMKLGKAAAVLFLALAMAGCGGGGGTTGPVGPTPPTADEERMAVSGAIATAEAAVMALTVMSTEAEVAAAQSEIDAAKVALAATNVLTTSDVLELQREIATVETALGTKKMQIADYGTHQGQLNAANTAVTTAKSLVGGLTNMSSDDDLNEAQSAINAAKKAVMDGTMLTEGERTALDGEIMDAETALGTARTQIADYRTHQRQLNTANTAIATAEGLVGGLTNMSSDDDLNEAQSAINAAKKAVMDGTMLTEGEVASLTGKIAIAEVALLNARTDIANYNTHNRQLTAATDAVGDAEEAVAALNINSTDDQVMAAKGLIADAEQAIEDGTTLTDEQKNSLNTRISDAKSDVSGVERLIALRKAVNSPRKSSGCMASPAGQSPPPQRREWRRTKP